MARKSFSSTDSITLLTATVPNFSSWNSSYRVPILQYSLLLYWEIKSCTYIFIYPRLIATLLWQLNPLSLYTNSIICLLQIYLVLLHPKIDFPTSAISFKAFVLFCFETGHTIVWVGLELIILLPQPPVCYRYRPATLHLCLF
jgi:hypothetical protein